MSVAGSVSVDELVRALDRKSATLPAEIAAFIAFSGCESMLEQGPRELASPAQVRIHENGAVVLSGPGCDETPGARSLHRVLVLMLQAAGRNLPPALQRLRDRPEQEINSLRSLLDQLEATLVPLNRTASRRVLARFAREAAVPLIDPGAVDAALSSLLNEEPPANDGRRARSLEPDARPLQVDLLEGLELDDGEHYLESRVSAPSRLSDFEGASSARASVRPSMAPGAPGKPSIRSQASGLEELGSPSSSRKLFIGFALVAAAVLVVIAATSIRDENARQELLQAEAAAAIAEASKPAPASAGNLVVHVSEPNAQVLRYVGRAPVSIDKLPVGVAHEFVATAEGHVPTRALVPANAEWEAGSEGARYELAMQLNEGDDALNLGPSRLTSQGSAKGTGSIRVISTPRSARVYQLIGFSPDVKVENLPLDAPQELLIYREGFTPVLRTVQPSDFVQQGDERAAEVTVELKKKR